MNYTNHKLYKATGGALDAKIIERLVGAGYTTPGKIKDATNGQLKAIPGVGQAQVDAIREVLPKR